MASNAKYYEILGVENNASIDEIKAAYHRLALMYHPDKSEEPGTEEKFKEINRAYHILTDNNHGGFYDRRW